MIGAFSPFLRLFAAYVAALSLERVTALGFSKPGFLAARSFPRMLAAQGLPVMVRGRMWYHGCTLGVTDAGGVLNLLCMFRSLNKRTFLCF